MISNENQKHSSELGRNVTLDKFKTAYRMFMEQAEKNAISKKSEGKRFPYGFSDNYKFDGAGFLQHFGQGAASKTPYMNWWVVSIYYIVDSGAVIMGIEENRYPYLNKMKPYNTCEDLI